MKYKLIESKAEYIENTVNNWLNNNPNIEICFFQQNGRNGYVFIGIFYKLKE